MAITRDRLNERIKSQKDAILYHAVYGSSLFLAGVAAILTINVFPISLPAGDTAKMLISIGGCLISSVSLFPVNVIISRREKMKVFQMFEKNLDQMNDDERKRLEEFIWTSIEKI